MSLLKATLMLAIVALFFTGVYGCKKEGPAESAGKKIDKAFEDAKQKLDESTK